MEEGEHILIKNNCMVKGKRKIKFHDNKIMATISNNYGFGIYSILINEIYGNCIEGDELKTNC